jgi:2-dehydro-3-deoxyphosphogluconate aldolase/(4S)-4-hydroxy-2-oxoglutarate aldolase
MILIMDIERFKKKPLMGILRGVPPEYLDRLVDTVIDAGLETLEVAMNSRGAGQAIRRIKKRVGRRLAVGAGTVMDRAVFKQAIDAGATYIVTPVLVKEVIQLSRKSGLPVFPGAFSPAEIYRAWQSGAAMVKVFPTAILSPRYFKEIKGPFPQIELMACGGVDAANISDYFAAGASAAAFGGSVFRLDWMKKGQFSRIARAIRALLAGIRRG